VTQFREQAVGVNPVTHEALLLEGDDEVSSVANGLAVEKGTVHAFGHNTGRCQKEGEMGTGKTGDAEKQPAGGGESWAGDLLDWVD
jgi:hypothetical protein